MGKATDDLRNEHGSIINVLSIMDRMISPANSKTIEIKIQHGKEIIHFLRIFADKCHHGKEENHLFKELIGKSKQKESEMIGVLLQEHHQGREYIALMSTALEVHNLTEFFDAATKYRTLLLSHIDKENTVLFIMADQLLNEAEQDELFDKFVQHEESIIGHGVHEELHAMIHRWTEEYKST